jgi:hypothetical protein
MMLEEDEGWSIGEGSHNFGVSKRKGSIGKGVGRREGGR